MRTPLRSFITATAVGLALAPSALADDTVTDLYVARDACGGTDAANLRLASAVGAFTSGCGSLVGGLGGSDSDYATTASDEALPVTLDTTRPIHVEVAVSSDPGVLLGGIGDETVSLTLTGTRGTKTVDLGMASETTPLETMLQQTEHVYTFDLPLDITKAGTYSGFDLILNVGGSQQSGYVNHGGGSYVELPVPDPAGGETTE
ncbi:MAG: hypothetical protein ACJ762_02025 [Solirubrobacteraceae bacterium]